MHPGLSVHLVNMPRAKDGYRHVELDARFAELVRSFEPNVAHIGHLNHLSTGIVDVLERAGIPIVYTLHDFWLMCPRGQFLQRNFGQGRLHELCDGRSENCATTCYSSAVSTVIDGRTIGEEGYWSKWVAFRNG
ncbi:MAG: glycosyltransferase [Flavobacteriales bacterium]|nr:glycosyltransferase [Flavobacteriales bacterium]